MDLSDGMPPLLQEDGIGGIYIVFWWHSVPLGQCNLDAAQLPLSAHQVEELAVNTITLAVGDHLFEHGFKASLPDMPDEDEPCDLQALLAVRRPLATMHKRQEEARRQVETSNRNVSLVICTRNRPHDLQRCLASLRGLTRRPRQIVVVDNCTETDATRRLVESEAGIEYVLESQPGLSHARNAGIAHSRGEIIAFTDDDVVVHPDWLQDLLQGFEDPEVMAVNGPTFPAELETRAQISFQQGQLNGGWGYRQLNFDAGFFEHTRNDGAPVWRIGAGANMAFRKQFFEQAGVFDERLGAGASGCSEDSEMWYRVLAEGWICRYQPTGAVFHYHRRDTDGLNHQMHHYMRGHVAALLVQWENYRHWGDLHRAYGILPVYYAKRVLHRVLKRGGPRQETVGAEILGCLAGTKFYMQHRFSHKRRPNENKANLNNEHNFTGQ